MPDIQDSRIYLPIRLTRSVAHSLCAGVRLDQNARLCSLKEYQNVGAAPGRYRRSLAVVRTLDIRTIDEVVCKVLERDAAAAHGGPGSRNARQPQTEWIQTRQRRYAPVDDVLPQLNDLPNAGRPGPVRRVEGAAEDEWSATPDHTTADLKRYSLVESVDEVLARDRLAVRRDALKKLRTPTVSTVSLQAKHHTQQKNAHQAKP